MKTKDLLIFGGIVGAGFLLWKFVLKDKIAEKRAKKMVQEYDSFDLIAFEQTAPQEIDNIEYTPYENA